MTVATICLTIEHLQFRDKITELQMLRSVAYFTEYIMPFCLYTSSVVGNDFSHNLPSK